ncbi:MAG TPA: hypothetical protein VFX36_12045 [Nitrospira sp.]|jgi:hypothetical protein|nr:hypothetical protein [Nitrospira sp.]
MNARRTLGPLVLVIMTSSTVSAQSPCAECIKAAQEELKNCLDNAISVDDKNACEEKREEGMRVCEDKECTAEREAKESKKENLEQKR